MATPPASTKSSLQQRLSRHARDRWPALTRVAVRFHGQFAYIDGHLPDGQILPLCRLRYGGTASHWGFAICACGLYLNDPTAWLPDTTPTN